MRKYLFLILVFLSFSSNSRAESVNHSHDGRTHMHPLPSEGVNHNHTGMSKSKDKKIEYKQIPFSQEKTKQCISLQNEKTSALIARDNKNLIRLTKKYLSYCYGLDDPMRFAFETSGLSEAYISTGKYADALSVSNNCISNIYYGSPNCHISKAYALKMLGKHEDFEKSAIIAERLFFYEIKNEELKLKSEVVEIKNEQSIAYIDNYKTNLELLEILRNK